MHYYNYSYFLFSLNFQDLHRDIESHSQLIKTVLWQCGEIDAHRRQRQKRHRKRKSTNSSSSSVSQENHRLVSVLLSVGKIIEERWHCLWLRSLEWQCFLEQFTSPGPKGIEVRKENSGKLNVTVIYHTK